MLICWSAARTPCCCFPRRNWWNSHHSSSGRDPQAPHRKADRRNCRVTDLGRRTGQTGQYPSWRKIRWSFSPQFESFSEMTSSYRNCCFLLNPTASAAVVAVSPLTSFSSWHREDRREQWMRWWLHTCSCEEWSLLWGLRGWCSLLSVYNLRATCWLANVYITPGQADPALAAGGQLWSAGDTNIQIYIWSGSDLLIYQLLTIRIRTED